MLITSLDVGERLQDHRPTVFKAYTFEKPTPAFSHIPLNDYGIY